MKKTVIFCMMMLIMSVTAIITVHPGKAAAETDTAAGVTESETATKPPVQTQVFWQNKVAVLMYHQVDENMTGPVNITPELFASHLDMLQNNGFNVISLDQMEFFLQGMQGVPPNAVVITFDDGYQGVYNHAFPLLQERDMPAAVFMIVSRAGTTAGEIAKLTWEQMEEMTAGGVRIYSHSYDSHYYAAINNNGEEKPVLTHPLLKADGTRETRQEFLSRIYLDLLYSKSILEKHLGQPVRFFAAPYGKVNTDLTNVARYAGFSYIFITTPGLNDRKTPFTHLRRINVGSPEVNAETLKETLQNLAG